MKKTELIEKAALLSGTPKTQTAEVFKALVEVMSDALQKGEDVQIQGFGSFRVQDRAERQCRNPRTGETVTVPACRKVAFRIGSLLENRINDRVIPHLGLETTLNR